MGGFNCVGCGERFGSISAFDRHQHDDGRSAPCRPVAEFSELIGKKHKRPRLVWHERRQVWVTALDHRYQETV